MKSFALKPLSSDWIALSSTPTMISTPPWMRVSPRLVPSGGGDLVGFRFRKSITIAKGVRLNVSKGGLGVSAGPRGVRYSVHSSGRRTASAGIPGTGMGVVQTGGRSRAGAAPRRSPQVPPPREGPESAEAVRTRKPSTFAPKGEKALYQAWVSDDLSAMRQVSAMFPDYALAADALVGVKAAIANDLVTARDLLGRVFASGLEPAAHSFISMYLPTSRVAVELATGVTAGLPLNRDGIGLLLAEVHQALRDDLAAIDVVEQVEPTAHAAVSLAELYTRTGRHHDVIELTEGITNDDEATALLCVFRGIAFRDRGYPDAARETLKEALKTKKRDPVVRHRALLERARTYASEGKKAQARKDLERIMAEDSDYEGLKEAMDDLGG